MIIIIIKLLLLLLFTTTITTTTTTTNNNNNHHNHNNHIRVPNCLAIGYAGLLPLSKVKCPSLALSKFQSSHSYNNDRRKKNILKYFCAVK